MVRQGRAAEEEGAVAPVRLSPVCHRRRVRAAGAAAAAAGSRALSTEERTHILPVAGASPLPLLCGPPVFALSLSPALGAPGSGARASGSEETLHGLCVVRNLLNLATRFNSPTWRRLHVAIRFAGCRLRAERVHGIIGTIDGEAVQCSRRQCRAASV